MKPSVGRFGCACCEEISDQEFQKLVELKDAGVAIYRYVPATRREGLIDIEAREIFVLRNIGNENLKLEDFIVELGKTNISCPRCVKMIKYAEKIFRNMPEVNIRDITSVCDHCYMRQPSHCPCCEQTVDKFLKFSTNEAQQRKEQRRRLKSWLAKTQTLLKRTFLNVQGNTLEPRARSEDRIRDMSPTAISGDQSRILSARSIPLTKRVCKPETKRIRKEKNVEEEIIKTPFPDFSQEFELIKTIRRRPSSVLKIRKDMTVEDESGILTKNRKRAEEDAIETPLKVTTFFDFSEEHELVKTTKPTTILETSKARDKNKSEHIKMKIKAEGETITPFKEANFQDFSKEIKPHKIKRQSERTSILKSHEGDGVPENIIVPHGGLERSVPPKSYSFDTVLKNRNEADLSNFSYTFPREKTVTNKSVKGRVSSSELIKNTQNMLQERAEAEKKKREEELKKRREEEERKRIEREKKAKTYSQKKLITEEPDKTGTRSIEITKFIKESSEASSSHDITAEKKKHESKLLIRKDSIAIPEEQEKVQKPVIKEKEMVATEVKSDVIKRRTAKSEHLLDKTKEPEQAIKVGKKHDTEARDDLKKQITKQAKEDLQAEKEKKKQEKINERGEKKAMAAEKDIGEKQQLLTEKKIKSSEPKLSKTDELEKIKQPHGIVKEPHVIQKQTKQPHVSVKEPEKKVKEDKKHDNLATTDLNKQLGKNAKAELEAEKNRKQQEKEQELNEKKAKQTEKMMEDRQQVVASKKIGVKTDVEPESPKQKVTSAEPLKKNEDGKKQHDTAAANTLKDELMQQKRAELEAEKMKKQQEKEKELLEARLKLVQKLMDITAPATIKAPTLSPEQFSLSSGDVSEIQTKPDEVTDIIIGDEIYEGIRSDKKSGHKQAISTSKRSKKQKHNMGLKPEKANQYATQISRDEKVEGKTELQHDKPLSAQKLQPPNLTVQTADNKKLAPEPDAPQGVIRYALSDCTFIDKGWTMLPTEKVVRKMNVYRMRPAKPEFDWFEHHKHKRVMRYDSGELLAEFDDNGRGRWYYRNGKLALDYYDAKEINAGQRFVVYSNGEPDESGRSRPRTVLATFDYLGNGIVFDHAGKIRLKYNQTEGVVLDRSIGPPSHWKWHTLNDPPILQRVMIDSQMPYKDPKILQLGDKNATDIRPDNEDMVTIEFENFLKEKSQKLTQSFKPFQIKMKAMKINENFSLRVNDQASVYLLYRDGTTNLKINMGMVLDHKEIVDTDTAEIGEVSNTLDKLPARTDSIAGLQRAVSRAQAHERSRVHHESFLKRSRQRNSVDELRAGCSRPLRPPLYPSSSTTSISKTTPSRFKPSCCNLYYNTQLY